MTTRTPSPRITRPWQRRRARPFGREVVLFDRPPIAQICIYDSCCIVTRRRPDGTWTSYPITPDALAQALGRLPVSTGLLPEGMIGTGLHQGDPFFVQLIRPRPATLLLDDNGTMRSAAIRLPPLIWAGWRTEYRIFALQLADRDVVSQDLQLYRAPFPNLYDNGSICWGSAARRPPASPTTLTQALNLFLEGSRFNSHLSGNKSRRHTANVLRAYDALTASTPYPLDDLVPTDRLLRLRDALSGAIWRGGL
jgi:hypothetical protein